MHLCRKDDSAPMTFGTGAATRGVLSRELMRLLRWAGLVTWISAGVPTLLQGDLDLRWLACWLAFGVVYWIDSAEERTRHILTLVAQTLLAFGTLAFKPTAFMPVLFVIVAGGLGHAVRMPVAMSWVLAQSIGIAILLGTNRWPLSGTLPVAGAYCAFQFFALLATHLAMSESRARSELAIANAELRAAADLLEAGSRTSERLRIARDLHDLLGHHLTALSVNLEVAAHLTDGKAREHVEQAQSLAKLLLSDVRAVVSDLRDDQTIDIAAMLARVVEPIPAPRVNLHVASEVRVTDPAVAQTLLRAVQEIVTNAMRHSGASTLTIDVTASDGAIALHARDDGRGASAIHIGNGLRGMQERSRELGGSVDVRSQPGRGFEVRMELPA
jgi:signal transduction histidine kinase